jgi:heme/copper-type cytochrome/quinol oxidase subunit 1
VRPGTSIVALVAGVLCAAGGVGLASRPYPSAEFGWTAYSPLTSAVYRPFDPVSALWLHGLGLVLLALGAGAIGAAVTALVLRYRGSRAA